MFKRTKVKNKVGEGENPFLLCFSDFMASLLAIFILIVIVMVIQLQQAKQRLEDTMKLQSGHWVSETDYKDLQQLKVLKSVVSELNKHLEEFDILSNKIDIALNGIKNQETAIASLISGIKDDLEKQGIQITADLNNQSLHINDKSLSFEKGSSEIPVESQKTAKQIGISLYNALLKPENRKHLDTVFIEGHTDSTPYLKPMGNWGLSTYRAISLWLFWTEKPAEVGGLKDLKTIPLVKGEKPKLLISVSGYADTRSTHSDEIKYLKNDRPEDRRIDIRFTMASSEKNDIQDAKNKWDELRSWFSDVLIKIKKAEHEPKP
jgi:flagellar motor protein MotB